jgi:hypothetical protein
MIPTGEWATRELVAERQIRGFFPFGSAQGQNDKPFFDDELIEGGWNFPGCGDITSVLTKLCLHDWRVASVLGVGVRRWRTASGIGTKAAAGEAMRS